MKDKEKKHLEAIDTLKLEVAKLREERAITSSECQTFFEDLDYNQKKLEASIKSANIPC